VALVQRLSSEDADLSGTGLTENKVLVAFN